MLRPFEDAHSLHLAQAPSPLRREMMLLADVAFDSQQPFSGVASHHDIAPGQPRRYQCSLLPTSAGYQPPVYLRPDSKSARDAV